MKEIIAAIINANDELDRIGVDKGNKLIVSEKGSHIFRSPVKGHRIQLRNALKKHIEQANLTLALLKICR